MELSSNDEKLGSRQEELAELVSSSALSSLTVDPNVAIMSHNQERLAQRGEKAELKWLGLLGTRLRPNSKQG